MGGNTASNDEKLQNNNNVPNEDGKQVDEYKAKHDALYGKYTAKAEKEMELSRKLFKNNPTEIESFSDSVKNKIIKEEYGYDTFEEAKAVLGDKFYISKDDNGDEEDEILIRLSQLEKERRISEYKSKKEILTSKIDLYITKNNLTDDFKDTLMSELELISDKLELDQRIEKAAALAKIKHGSNDVSIATQTSGGSKNIKTLSNEAVPRNPDLARVFGNKF